MGSKPKKISGSRVSSLLNINPWKTDLELWFELIHEEYPGWLEAHGYIFKPEDISDKPSIKLGLLLEKHIINFNCMNAKNHEKLYTDGNILSCHVDAEFDDGLIEAKITNLFTFWSDWGEPGTDQIPDYYYCQVQLQMGLANKKECIVPLLIFPERQSKHMYKDFSNFYTDEMFREFLHSMATLGMYKTYNVQFDKNVFEKIKSKAYEWWKKHIIGKMPPMKNIGKVDKLILPVHGDVEATDDICDAIMLYNDTRRNFKEKESEVKEIKSAILNYMIKHGTKGKSGFLRVKKDGKVLATYNGKTGRFSIMGIK